MTTKTRISEDTKDWLKSDPGFQREVDILMTAIRAGSETSEQRSIMRSAAFDATAIALAQDLAQLYDLEGRESRASIEELKKIISPSREIAASPSKELWLGQAKPIRFHQCPP